MTNPNFLAFIVSEIPTFVQMVRQTDMPSWTRIVILVKNIYTYFAGTKTLPSTCYCYFSSYFSCKGYNNGLVR